VGSDSSEVACDLSVFGNAERERYRELSRQIWAACREKRELDDGVALRFESSPEIRVALAEFVPLERRCCPFLTLEIVPAEDGETVDLRVTGGAGVKAFLAEETAKGR